VRGALAAALVVSSIAVHACGGGSAPAGQPCTQASDCYPGVDPTTISGAIQCLDKVPGGYCTHLCQTDADCCKASGECPSGHPEVCAPFEDTGMMMCFLSCEASVLDGLDENTYCAKYADSTFTCRSTGGGSKNRKICSP
jgi:hypothetical protein